MTTRPQKKNVSIQQVLNALLDDNTVFPPAYWQQFSDLEGADLEAVRSVWPQASARRRFTLLEDLEELTETDTLVNFDNLARLALIDADPRVRTVAIRLLWEAEDPRLAGDFMRMLDADPSDEVRAAAATALGSFIYEGELEEIPENLLHDIEERLLAVLAGNGADLVRRRALESLGFSSRPEVTPLIRQAYQSDDPEWVGSALFAMGRSADQAWAPDILRVLRSPKAKIQLEAVRAAGALEIDRSRRVLLDLLEEEAQDSEIRAAVIWSLSQIGGEEVRDTLEAILESSEDDEEIEILENALDNLSFTEDVGLYGLFDFNQLGEAEKEIDNIEEYNRRQQIEDGADDDLELPNTGLDDDDLTAGDDFENEDKSSPQTDAD